MRPLRALTVHVPDPADMWRQLFPVQEPRPQQTAARAPDADPTATSSQAQSLPGARSRP